LNAKSDAYRLIHAESDGFPGLAIDRYGDVLSAEVFSAGMYQRSVQILERLALLCGTKHYLVQTSPMFLSHEGFDASSIRSADLPKSVTTQEWGTKFRIHFETGHKTGFFCDQRDNRLKLASLCHGKSVLDLCCYTGGFSIQAAKLGGAAEVTGIDLDEEPLANAKKNADLNQVRVKFAQADAFAYMRDMLRLGRQYDIVVLDPPKLIRNRAEMEDGSKKHFDLNRLAMQLVRPGGLLLTCSCAGLLPSEDFFQMIRSAAKATGYDLEGKPRPPRTAQIISRGGAAEDHPVVTHCPETEYLKSIWLRLL
jgi:23S rRNA (cytosine1962-C5)-methyltransferase